MYPPFPIFYNWFRRNPPRFQPWSDSIDNTLKFSLNPRLEPKLEY